MALSREEIDLAYKILMDTLTRAAEALAEHDDLDGESQAVAIAADILNMLKEKVPAHFDGVLSEVLLPKAPDIELAVVKDFKATTGAEFQEEMTKLMKGDK